MYQALVRGDIEEGELPCGQNAAMIDTILSAAEVVQSMVRSVPLVMDRLSWEGAV